MCKIEEIRKDFPLLVKHPEVVYLDTAATSLKPQCVIDAITEYYTDYSANPHAEDYEMARVASEKFEEARAKIAKFINAEPKEVCFTSGDTAGLNTVAFAIAETLSEGDEVLLTIAEHASNVLPWFKVKDIKKINIGYIELNEDGKVTLEAVEKAITPNTKVISVAHITNVLGYKLDIKGICEIAHKHNIMVVVDAAQSVPHTKIDVKDLDCDFLLFSGHKMLGPTGIGVLYGKYQHLLNLNPLFNGGGNNTRFDTCGNYHLQLPPHKFECGTQNIAGAIGMGVAVDYINKIGIDFIENRERELRDYALSKLKQIEGVKIYNEGADCGIITFNYKDVFAQDMATHLASYNVCCRSGQHCAKILLNYLETVATVRASLYFYNTFEEIDKFVEAVSKGDEFLDAFFR